MMNRTFRRSVFRSAGFSLLSLMLSVVAFAADKDDKTDTTIVSGDGWPLKLTYYKSTEDRESPVIVLLHGKNETRMSWTNAKGEGLATDLHRAGFAVISLDLRKHGQSKPGETEDDPAKQDPKAKSTKKGASSDLRPVDYQAMVVDLAAVKKFIYEEHQKEHLNMRKTAFVTSGMSAAIAMTFAVEDWARKPYNDAPTIDACTPRGQDVQSFVFLSPETNVPGLQAHVAAAALKQLPVTATVFVGTSDSSGKEQAKKLFQQLGGDPAVTQPKKSDSKKEKSGEKSGKEEKFMRLEYIELPGKVRGTDLLGKKLPVEAFTTEFLKAHLKELKGPHYEWRDRKSKLAE